MPRTTEAANTAIEREAFTLTLPEVFNVQPDWTIDLPRKWKAYIYVTEANAPLEDSYGKLRVSVDGKLITDPRPYYRVRIITPKGRVSRNFHQSGSHDPLTVMETLRDAVDKLTIKTVEQKRIRREEGTLEDEE